MPLGTHLGAKIAQVGAKMALSCPTWRQDVLKMANLEPKMANLAHFWEHLGNLFCILGAILPKMAKTKKTTTAHYSGRFFPILETVLEAKLAHLGAIGACWRHLVATWR